MASLEDTGFSFDFLSLGDSHGVFVRETLGIHNLGTSSSCVQHTQYQTCNYDQILILLPLYLLSNNLCHCRKPFFTSNEAVCQDNFPSSHSCCSPGEPHRIPGNTGETVWGAWPPRSRWGTGRTACFPAGKDGEGLDGKL